jgi:luciferase family oxidoreductase group 1
MRLSVLDQSIAVAGRPHDQSIRNTVALAQHCEALGYDRFWVSEHHNHPTIVGTAPEIVIAAIAATTECIRIGSAGIMLPHYAPFKVAEVFRVLDALAPGRIDLGLGRAPGSDGRTAFALNPAANERPEHFPADVRDLLAWVHNEPLVDRHPFAAVQAYPQGPTAPEVWILGSSDYGAQVAALFGLPYCYAWFFSDGAGGERAIELYKRSYRPSARHPEPHSALCVLAFAAPACLVAHASRSGNPGAARIARCRRRRARQNLRSGARGAVPQGLLRRHRPRGGRSHRGAEEKCRRRRDGRRHLDPRREGAAGELHRTRQGGRLHAEELIAGAAPLQ